MTLADKNQATVKISRTLHQEAQPFIGEPPLPYTSIRGFMDDASRTKLKDLKKEYPKLVNKKGGQTKK